jgi:hypothetical protein
MSLDTGDVLGGAPSLVGASEAQQAASAVAGEGLQAHFVERQAGWVEG